MSPKERYAFVRGYRFALRKARRALDAMAQRWDDEIVEFTDKMQAAHEQTVQDINDEIDEVRAEIRAARQEFHRYRAVETAIAVERDPDTLLN